jgi:hypothetical protein
VGFAKNSLRHGFPCAQDFLAKSTTSDADADCVDWSESFPSSALKLNACLWSQILRHVNVTASFDAKKLVGLLLNLRSTEDAGLRKTLLKTNKEIQTLDANIAKAESEINELIYQLYGLNEQERKLVESGSV